MTRRYGVFAACLGLAFAMTATEAVDRPLKMPWTVEAVAAATKPGRKTIYRREGVDDDGTPVAGRLVLEVLPSEDGRFVIDRSFLADDGSAVSAGIISTDAPGITPFFSMGNDFEIQRWEEVEVPAGTFECLVVVVESFFGGRWTYWLVPDQPGVYARWVEHFHPEDEQQIVHELIEVSGPD